MEKRGVIKALGQLSRVTLTEDEYPECERCGNIMREYVDFDKEDEKYTWVCHNVECMEQDREFDFPDEFKDEQAERNKKTDREIGAFLKNPARVMNGFGVPEKYHGVSFDNFAGGKDIVESIKIGISCRETSLYLYGGCGGGKTHLAVSVLRDMYIQGEREMKFKSVPELLFEIRDSFRNDAKQSEWDIVDSCLSPRVMVLDDLGAEKTSEFSIATLYLILNSRLMRNKPTIVTSNLSRSQIESQVDQRIGSRFGEYKAIYVKMPDFRKAKKQFEEAK